jgi:fructan beta-fructosidase
MLGDIWSGSAVVDWKDSSGFFNGKPGLVAIFTHFKDGLQSQSIAYSLDKGRNWTKYEGNPVIPNPDLKDFRDPKVIWFEPTQQWVMVVSIDQKIRFYTSFNLKEWTMRSDFGEGQGSHAAVWECPDLFELPIEGTDKKKWVLMVSIGNNLSTDGSTAQYFIGDFDGVRFVNENEPSTTLWVDYGKDFYAAVSYSDIPKVDGRRIWLGWMSNWKYPFDMPTWTWRGNMSIPREVTLREVPDEGIRLIQKPIVELESLRGKSIHLSNKKVKIDNKALEDIQGTSYEIKADFELGTAKKFGFKILVGKDQETRIYYDVDANKLVLDRSKAGVTDFTNSFTGLFEGPLKPKKGKISLNIFVDVSTIEVFANDGELVFTNLVFPDPTSNGLELYAEGGSVNMKTFDYFPMQSVWRKK